MKLEIEHDFVPLKWRFLALGKCPKCNNRVVNEIVVKKTFSGEEVYKEVSIIVDEIEYMNYNYKVKKVDNKLIKS